MLSTIVFSLGLLIIVAFVCGVIQGILEYRNDPQAYRRREEEREIMRLASRPI